MAVLASSLPPGVSPPLTEDNDHNHNGLIVIVTSLALFLVLASLVIRIFASSKRGLMLQDDHVLFAAAVHYGWGKSRELIPFSDYTQMKKRTKWMVNAIIASCGLWTIVAILLLAIRCNSRPWTDIDSACGGLFPRWQAICALDIVLEAVILAYPAITIRNVQITLSKKLKVLAILNCRVILIPLSAVHLYYIHLQIYSSNPTLVGTYATIVAELHLSLSIVLLTVSCLKMFVAVYEDDHGLAYTEDASNSHSRSGRSGPKSWRSSRPVKDLSSFGSSCNEEEPILRTEATVSASSPPLEGHRRNAIMKSVQISVTRESIELGEMAGPSSAAIPRST
ncbi:cytochrome P450 family protein [Aspergillus niger]|nr:cytochrome P450 family protein [Aspergillus niger]